MRAIAAGLCIVAVLCLACEDPFFKPNVRSIERSLGAAVPIGYVGTLAMAAFEGLPTDCVQFATNCADPPCGGVVNIVVDDDCPLPLSDTAEGMVTVTGALMSEDTGLFAAVFTEVEAGSRRLMLKEVRAFIVTRFTDTVFDAPRTAEGVKVIFYDADMEFTTDDGVDVEQSQWIVDVANGGTPGDPSDDIMSVTGARQAAGAGEQRAEMNQTALLMVQMDAACRRNPVGGFGIIEAVNSTQFMDNGITMLGFHPECDGTADILLSVGTSVASTSTSVNLNLLD